MDYVATWLGVLVNGTKGLHKKAIDTNYYRPPTKWWEGNAFGRVCLSVHGRGGVHVTTTHDAIGQSRGSRGPSNTSSNMFTGEPAALLPRHFQTCSLCSPTSISKWTVGLRLKGLFVLYLFSMRLGWIFSFHVHVLWSQHKVGDILRHWLLWTNEELNGPWMTLSAVIII